MEKTFILFIVGSFTMLCIGAQLFSVNQTLTAANVVDYYYIH